eukprot:Nk52_evm1s2601 gene=Nk52_evmTU1s2601
MHVWEPPQVVQDFFERIRWYIDENFRKPAPLPDDLVEEWTSERDFIQLIDKGDPVVLAMAVKGCPITQVFQREFVKAAERYGIRKSASKGGSLGSGGKDQTPGEGSARFLWVDCGRDENAEQFCRSRKPIILPTVEMFHASKDPGQEEDENAIVRVQVFRSDMHYSCYGIREFMRLHGRLRDYKETELPPGVE